MDLILSISTSDGGASRRRGHRTRRLGAYGTAVVAAAVQASRRPTCASTRGAQQAQPPTPKVRSRPHQAHAGLGSSPRTILEELRQVQSVDVVLPIVDGPEVKVRCVIKPNEAHALLLDRLGIEFPRRLAIQKHLQGVVV